MKKVLVAMALFGSVAFAASLAVPWFYDVNDVDSYPPPAQGPFDGSNTYITLKNMTNSDITLTIRYWRGTGVEVTPSVNTFVLPANVARGFTPASNLPTTEGAGAAIPNCDESGGKVYGGSATITWSGSAGDIVGRVYQVDNYTGSGLLSAAYTLPAGQ